MRYTRVSTKRNLEYFLLIFISIKFPDNDERNVITNVIDKLAIEEEEEKKKNDECCVVDACLVDRKHVVFLCVVACMQFCPCVSWTGKMVGGRAGEDRKKPCFSLGILPSYIGTHI